MLQKEWSGIAKDVLQRLIDHMPRICEAIIKARGSYFDAVAI